MVRTVPCSQSSALGLQGCPYLGSAGAPGPEIPQEPGRAPALGTAGDMEPRVSRLRQSLSSERQSARDPAPHPLALTACCRLRLTVSSSPCAAPRAKRVRRQYHLPALPAHGTALAMTRLPSREALAAADGIAHGRAPADISRPSDAQPGKQGPTRNVPAHAKPSVHCRAVACPKPELSALSPRPSALSPQSSALSPRHSVLSPRHSALGRDVQAGG